ncbi:serine protease [Streptomyces sp. NPDC006879]|uniref:serine protease n=1 Tax=Streptomyces sp. NPDC006879 TaxID=3364767 RepID=UPI0036981506
MVELVRIFDCAGSPRGTGFVADDRGTVVTAHEAVDGLGTVVLRGPAGVSHRAGAESLTLLPELGLALVQTSGLGVPPLPVAAIEQVSRGSYVTLVAGGRRQARVLGECGATHPAAGRSHRVEGVLELALGTDGRDVLRMGGQVCGGPVLDATSGAVVAVLGTALRAENRSAVFALPLRALAARHPAGPLAELLTRNGATVPAYGSDLNLAGALHLTAICTRADSGPPAWLNLVRRAEPAREFSAFSAGDATVLGLVGAPGTGRTTELAALAARRASGPRPAPTVWLRGADLFEGDASIACALARALTGAARILTASGAREVTGATPERIAALADAAGRPLLVLLDAPEEMPPELAHRLTEWTARTADWLRSHHARLVVACRPEHWEGAGRRYPERDLHRPSGEQRRTGRPLPPCVPLGDYTPQEAAQARADHGIPNTALAGPERAHPLTLRLLAEVRAAQVTHGAPDRDEVFSAYLDLMCLRIAVRLAAGVVPPLRGSAVRRLAAQVSGRVHEAARRCLGPGQGQLCRAGFEELFPWRSGWAPAVLTEGLLVPAGNGYRFAHEELADWLQGAHLDLAGALDSLVHRHVGSTARRNERRGDEGRPGVPRHRIGPVLQSLLQLSRRRGPEPLARHLGGLLDSLEALKAETGAGPLGARQREAGWWAGRLLAEALSRLPDASAQLPLLRSLAERIAAQPGRWSPDQQDDGPAEFGGRFWCELALAEADRLDLLRRLVPADPPPGAPALSGKGDRYLDAAADRLKAEPEAVVPLLCGWFRDERPIAPVDAPTGAGGTPARPTRERPSAPDGHWSPVTAPGRANRWVGLTGAPGAGPIPRQPDAADRRISPTLRGPVACGAPVTVATAAQALLHTHRRAATDVLTEALVACAHPRADELLVALAEDEPAALCRAVGRWAHDERPERRVAAATYGRFLVPSAVAATGRDLLRRAALALLDHPGDTSLHPAALTLLVRDEGTRPDHLPAALSLFVAGDRRICPAVLAMALPTHPEQVAAAFRARLLRPGAAAAEVLRALAEPIDGGAARRAGALVQEYLDHHPEGIAHVAAFVERRLEHGPVARESLFPLVLDLLHRPVRGMRAALAPLLGAAGGSCGQPLRGELLDVLLTVLELEASAIPGSSAAEDLAALERLLSDFAGTAAQAGSRPRDLVHRIGRIMVRTPEGAALLDRRLVELARGHPAFARQMARWLAEDPSYWSTLLGPSARRMLERLGEPRTSTGSIPPAPRLDTDAGPRARAWQS